MRAGVVAVAALLSLAGCGGDDAVRVGSAGVTVELPAGWHSTAGYDGNVTDPLARVVVASSPIGPGPSQCQTSAYSFADDAVALVLVEWWGPADSPGSPPPPPRRFTPETLSIRRGLHECYPGRSGGLQFTVREREFGAYVFLGDEAPQALVEDLCRVLDTLEVTPERPRT